MRNLAYLTLFSNVLSVILFFISCLANVLFLFMVSLFLVAFTGLITVMVWNEYLNENRPTKF